MKHEKHEKFFQHSAILFIASFVASVTNLLFHAVMSRTISGIEYGVLVTMLNIVNLANTPIDALRTAITHFSTRLMDEGHPGDIRPLVWQWCRRLCWFSVPVLVLGFVFAPQLAAFFQLDSPGPIYVTAIIVAGSPYISIAAGGLLGLQEFLWMALAIQSWGVVRIVVGWALVIFIAKAATWALAGQAVGVVICTSLGLLALHLLIGKHKASGKKRNWRENYYFGSALTALTGLAVLMNADMIIVKHYFPSEEAGLYARTFIIGRMAVFLCIPIAMAMFPKVVSEGHSSHQDWKTLMKAVGASMVIVLCAVVGVIALPQLPLWVIHGKESITPESVRILRWTMLAMGPLGLTLVLTNFEIAQHRFGTVPTLLAAAAAYIGGAVMWHDSVYQVIAVLGVVSTVATILLIFNLPWKTRKDDSIAGQHG